MMQRTIDYIIRGSTVSLDEHIKIIFFKGGGKGGGQSVSPLRLSIKSKQISIIEFKLTYLVPISYALTV